MGKTTLLIRISSVGSVIFTKFKSGFSTTKKGGSCNIQVTLPNLISNLIPVVIACSLSFMVGLVGVRLCDLWYYSYWHSLCFLALTVSFSVPFQHQITCLWETIAILVHNNYVLTSFKISLFLNKPEFKPRLFFF